MLPEPASWSYGEQIMGSTWGNSGGWGRNTGHACAVQWSLSSGQMRPTAPLLERIRRAAVRCLLPASWHHASKLLLRSRKAFMLEKQRQMSSRCWFVVHPYSSFKFFCDCLNFIGFFCTSIYLPIQIFHACPNQYDPLILTRDALSFVAIIINFVTGYVDEDGQNIVLDHRQIALHYIKRTFLLELIAALPLQCITLFEDCTLPTHTLFFLPKILRTCAVSRAWHNISEQMGLSYTVIVTSTMLVRVCCFYHWITFCHYQVPILYSHIIGGPQAIAPWLQRVKAIHANYTPAPIDRYITNLYYVSGISYGAGVYSNTLQRDMFLPEQVLVSIVGIIGLIFMTYAFTTLLRLVVYHHFESYLYNGRLKELHEYLDFKRLPKSLKEKVQLYINYRFNGHYFNANSILDTINVHIKQEINMYCCKKLVVNVPMFQNMPIALINSIIFSLTQVLYMPGEIVVKYGHPGSSIYLIASGTVAIMNAEGKEVGHLKDGAFFGERALLQPGTARSATIVALEITEIYKTHVLQTDKHQLVSPKELLPPNDEIKQALNHNQLQACLRPVPRAPRRAPRRTTPASPGADGQSNDYPDSISKHFF